MSWNLRVVFNNKTKKIGFKEVYYTKVGRPKSWTKEFVKPEEYLKDKFVNPEALKKALQKPILKENEKSLTELSKNDNSQL